MNILITGTSTGIGAELFSKLSLDNENTVICGNRTITNTTDIQLDMSSQESIMEFVSNLTENNKKFDMIILNAGTKATRKRVDWNGKKLNMCRVVNLLANDYLMAHLKLHNLINADAKIVFMTSITHWTAQDNPCSQFGGDDPEDATWANQQYPNTKFGLFILGKKLKQMNPEYDIILCNPGMVSTKIFGDKNADGLIPSSVRYLREMLSMTPSESADYIVKSIMTKRSDSDNKTFRYFTPYQSPSLLGYFERTQILQDVMGLKLLSRTNSDTDNFSKRVMNDVVEQNYEKYLSY